MQETWVRALGQEDSLEKEIATHSSILAWRIPLSEEPGGLQSMGSPKVEHSRSDRTHATINTQIYPKGPLSKYYHTGDRISIYEPGGEHKYSIYANMSTYTHLSKVIVKIRINRKHLKGTLA